MSSAISNWSHKVARISAGLISAALLTLVTSCGDEENTSEPPTHLDKEYSDEVAKTLQSIDPSLTADETSELIQQIASQSGSSEALGNSTAGLSQAKSAFISPIGWNYKQCRDYFGAPRTRSPQGVGFSTVKNGYVLKIRLLNEESICAKAFYYHTDDEKAFLAALDNGAANSSYRIEIPQEALAKLVKLNGINAPLEESGSAFMWRGSEYFATYAMKVFIVKPTQK